MQINVKYSTVAVLSALLVQLPTPASVAYAAETEVNCKVEIHTDGKKGCIEFNGISQTCVETGGNTDNNEASKKYWCEKVKKADDDDANHKCKNEVTVHKQSDGTEWTFKLDDCPKPKKDKILTPDFLEPESSGEGRRGSGGGSAVFNLL